MELPINVIPLEKNLEESAKRFILNILENEYKLAGKKRLDLEAILDYYRRGGGNFWAALAGDKIVGTIALKEYPNGRGNLRRFYVERSLRGTGLGSALFIILLEYAKTNGFTEMYVSVSEQMNEVVPFYEHRGFRKIEALPSDISPSDDTTFLKLIL